MALPWLQNADPVTAVIGKSCLVGVKMTDLHDLRREVVAISTVLLGILLNGYIMGFSSVALPDIKADMRWRLDWHEMT